MRVKLQNPVTPDKRTKRFTVQPYMRNGIIYFKLFYNKKSVSFSTGITTQSALFNKEALYIKGDESSTDRLQALKSDLVRTYTDLTLTKRNIDLRLIKNLVLNNGVCDEKPTLIECLKKFLKEEFEALEGIEYEPKTVRKKQYIVQRIEQYIITIYGNSFFNLSDLRPIDAHNLVTFCKKTFGHGHNHAVLHAEFLKRTLNYAIANEWIEKNPLQFFKPKRERKKIEALTESEISKLQNTNFSTHEYIYVKDVFLFCCYTGLSYIDVARLNETHLVNMDSTTPLIKITRGKNDNECIIPLVPNAIAILDKYRNLKTAIKKNSLLPIYSNQAMNRILKEVQALAGIDLRLTTHIARKTCATFYINNGVPLTSVATMLGHKKTSTTEQYYTQRTEDTVLKHFKEFQNKIEL